MRRLGRDRKADVWVDVGRYPGLELVPGVLAVRVDGPLFFADANRFCEALNEMIRSNPEPVRVVVVDATATSQTDTDGADIAIQIAEELHSQGVSLAFATWNIPSSTCGPAPAPSMPSVRTMSLKPSARP